MLCNVEVGLGLWRLESHALLYSELYLCFPVSTAAYVVLLDHIDIDMKQPAVKQAQNVCIAARVKQG